MKRNRAKVLVYLMVFCSLVSWAVLMPCNLTNKEGERVSTVRAVDPYMYLFWDGASNAPTGWSYVSDAGGAFYNKLIRANSAYDSDCTDNAPACSDSDHSHSVSTSNQTTNAAAGVWTANAAGQYISIPHSNHTYTTSTATAGKTRPPDKSLRVIKYNSTGTPPTIPSGAIAIYERTADYSGTDWAQYSAMDDKFVRGLDAAATTGGDATHTHDLTLALGGTTSSARVTAGGIALSPGHTHASVTRTSLPAGGSTDHLPLYVNVVLAQCNKDITGFPNKMITMWDGSTPPAGWDKKTDVDARYLRSVATPLGWPDRGGASTHSHAMTITSSNSSSTAANAISGAPGKIEGSGVHTHDVDFALGSVNNAPVYIDVVLAKRNATFTPKTKNWRVYDGELGATSSDPTFPIANENTTNTDTNIGYKLNAFKIRWTVKDVGTGTPGDTDIRFKPQFSTDEMAWSDLGAIDAAGRPWRYYNGGGTDDATIADRDLTDSDTSGTYNEVSTSSTFDFPGGGASVELEYSIQFYSTGSDTATTYYFQLYDTKNAAAVALDTSETHPSILTSSAFALSVTAPAEVAFANYNKGGAGTNAVTFSSPTEDITAWDTRGTAAGWTVAVTSASGMPCTAGGCGADAIPNTDMDWTNSNTINAKYASITTGLSSTTGSLDASRSAIAADATEGIGGFYIDPTITLNNLESRTPGTFSGVITITIS